MVVYHFAMGQENKPQLTSDAKPVRVQNPARTTATLVVGLLLGASLGPALFLAADRIELKGDVLLSFAVGAFLTLGICLMLAAFAALLILPRVFANARGTLAGMVDDLAEASRAHALGNADKAFDHLGKAVSEGVAWYSVGATRRFAVRAALGLLIAFGGSIGAVLLFSQNALLRDQNAKIDEQVKLLGKQNEMLAQQTAIAEAQKRGAFLTEMFLILQQVAEEISKKDGADGSLPKQLVARIAVLTTSAVPYRYLSRADPDESESVVLSPERGQLLVALSRMSVDIRALTREGATFDFSDFRGLDLANLNVSGIPMRNCDFSYADLSYTKFNLAGLNGALFKKVSFDDTNFAGADLFEASFVDSESISANFTGATLIGAGFFNGSIGRASFEHSRYSGLKFFNVGIVKTVPLPIGLPWPSDLQKSFEGTTQGSDFVLTYEFPGT